MHRVSSAGSSYVDAPAASKQQLRNHNFTGPVGATGTRSSARRSLRSNPGPSWYTSLPSHRVHVAEKKRPVVFRLVRMMGEPHALRGSGSTS